MFYELTDFLVGILQISEAENCAFNLCQKLQRIKPKNRCRKLFPIHLGQVEHLNWICEYFKMIALSTRGKSLDYII